MLKPLFSLKLLVALLAVGIFCLVAVQEQYLDASSHREAPMISNDPLADNTDVYAFRIPNDPNNIAIIANYIPGQLPEGGPNYYTFGENVLYEIHIKNDPVSKGDDIVYRFTFKTVNEDPTTFFNVRLKKQNPKTTFTCERSTDCGKKFQTIISNGIVPPYNSGPRSIESAVGLGSNYDALMRKGITKASTGELVFCGPVDDPFFVDLGGIFDLGNIRPGSARDGLARKNVHTIALSIPIETLQKDHKNAYKANGILDSEYVIGVWASASRRRIRVFDGSGKEGHIGDWIQVSRLGMPLTNEVVMPIGQKDYWNSLKPYNEDKNLEKYFTNPELALYMDDELFGSAVPGFAALRVQRNSLQQFDFGNGKDGLAGLLGNPATRGTAFDKTLFGNFLLRKGQPRSADILPIFLTGVPNLPPYQLATGKKGGNPLAKGKPFVNNFLPTFGDMLRLNMAVPPTQRDDRDFSSLGLVQAAVLGLTDPRFNTDRNLQNIPNMDGFPNGRRLEDDVTRIELQAVSGVVLAAIGLWYDDYPAGSPNPVTTDLLDVLTFTTGVEANDTTFKTDFPYEQAPWRGFDYSKPAGDIAPMSATTVNGRMSDESVKNLSAPSTTFMVTVFPNPTTEVVNFKYTLPETSKISIKIFDKNGAVVSTPLSQSAKEAGTHETSVNVGNYLKGTYYAVVNDEFDNRESIKFIVQ
jgi:hypothetical protein